jgi:ribosome-associated protein
LTERKKKLVLEEDVEVKDEDELVEEEPEADDGKLPRDSASIPHDLDYEKMARDGAEGAEEKKATRVTVMHLGETSPVCDYFVLASGKTRLQTRAIANSIDDKLNYVPFRRLRQGYQTGSWILLDYGNVVFHVFLDREREYYDLEGLYAKAPVVYMSTDDEVTPSPASPPKRRGRTSRSAD